MTLGSGQRVGLQAFADRLHLWRGEPDAREAEEYPSWWGVANRVYGMMLMGQWLEAPKEATADKAVAFALPQEAIDYVLTANGTSYKLRIYEQFQKQDGSAKNIRFLKDLYGIGGHSDAIPGSGYWEDHDAKGITISDGSKKLLLPWAKAEKRIGELIAADRYLSRADMKAYPAFRQEREAKEARAKIGEEFNSIIREYNDYRRQLGDTVLLNQYVLTDCGQAFSWGRRTTHTLNENNFILPLMRDALQAIIADTSPLKDRAEAMLVTLNGEIAKPFEPTYEELNPPKKEYRYAFGDTVHLGTQEYEILAFNEQEVRLYDTEFPLLNKTMPREEFDRKVAENPLNDRLLVVVEEQAEPATEPSSLSIEDADGYNAIKEAHTDELVLYRVGDFYEMYGEDAKAAAKLLDLTVTSRNVVGLGRTEMCGIPAARLDSYVEQLRDTQDVVIADACGTGVPVVATAPFAK